MGVGNFSFLTVLLGREINEKLLPCWVSETLLSCSMGEMAMMGLVLLALNPFGIGEGFGVGIGDCGVATILGLFLRTGEGTLGCIG